MKIRTSVRLSLLLALALAASRVVATEQQAASGFRQAAHDTSFPSWAEAARYNQPLKVRDTESAIGRLDTIPKVLTLRDVALVQGHLCDGLVIAWVELGVALRQLSPDGVVDRTDLRVVSKNGPCWADAAAWLTGARVNHGTLILDNSVGDAFILQRVSIMETVRVRLRPGTYPSWLAELERRIRARRAQHQDVDAAEIDRFEFGAAGFSRWLLNTPPGGTVEVESLAGFVFPTASPNPVVPRSDVINRDQSRTRRLWRCRRGREKSSIPERPLRSWALPPIRRSTVTSALHPAGSRVRAVSRQSTLRRHRQPDLLFLAGGAAGAAGGGDFSACPAWA